MVGTYVPLGDPDWAVMTELPVVEAYRPVIRNGLTSIAVLLCMSALAGWLGIFLACRLVTPIVDLTRAADRVTEGQLDVRAPMEGPTKVVRLSSAFNQMTRQLGGMLDEEAERTRTLEREISRRKKMAEELRRNERMLRRILDIVPSMIFAKNAQGRFLMVNQAIADSLSMTVDQLTGRLHQDVHPDPDQVARMLADDRKAMDSGGTVFIAEEPYTDGTGATRWLQTIKVPCDEDEFGEPAMVGLATDITERKRAEESLRLTQFIFDKAPIGIWRMGAAGEVLDVNEQGCASLGYSKDALCRMSVFDFDPNFDDAEVWARNRDALEKLGTTTIESRHRRKGGEVFPIEVIQNLVRFEDQTFHVAFVQDITERKRAEASLRDKDQLLQDIGRLVKIGAWRFDLETGKATTTDEVARICDFEPFQDVNAKKVLECYHGVHRERMEFAYDELIDQGTPYDLELEIVSATGIRKWVRTIGYPVREDGRIVAAQGSFQDISERKQMEQALKESEQRLDLALSGANEGIWDWRIKENILYLDSRYYTMAGYQPYAFPEVFDEILKRVHKDDLEQTKSINDRYLAGRLETFEAEFRFLRQDGSYMWIQAKGKIVEWDDEGNPARFVGTNADITARKQAETALREHEQLLANILESMNEGLLVLGSDFRYTIFNNALAKIVGVPKEAAIGQIPWEVFPYLNDTPVEKNMRKTMAGESSTNLEVKLCLPSRTAWCRDSFSPLKNQDGRIVGVIGVISDITRQKQDKEELHHLRNYLSNIIDSMPSLLVAVDRDGKVTQWNHQTEQTTGLSFDMARHQSLGKVFPRLSGEMERVHASIRERRVISSPKVSRKVNNETRYEDITIFPLVANGVEGAVIRVDDVTEKVRLEEMMIQSEKMLSVGGLAAGMAHEINNPLAGILQSSSVLSNRLTGDLPANQKAADAAGTTMEAIRQYAALRKLPTMLENIHTAGTLAASIVKNMLSFARKSENVVAAHDLGTLLDQSVDLLKTDYNMRKHYDFKQIKINRLYDEAAGPVPCESSKIQQVFMNILKNGAEAMAEATDEATRPTFGLCVQDDGDWVRVEIEDNGPGMAEATRRRIFEPFFTTKPVGQGTGLGLSVSYFIITEDHGGEMNVQAGEGGGTRFVVRIPKGGCNR